MADRASNAAQNSGYLPALRFRFLTPLFDSILRATVRESTFKPALLGQANLQPGQRVLDLGCGTGTLVIMAKQRQPECDVSGIDADPEILDLARRKAASARVQIDFAQGLAGELPYADELFDRVLSTLFFHHLESADKGATLAEIRRVLRPDGELHVADWTSPTDRVQAVLSWQVRLLDGVERTRANFAGDLPDLLANASLRDVREHQRLRTAFGTLGLLSAAR